MKNKIIPINDHWRLRKTKLEWAAEKRAGNRWHPQIWLDDQWAAFRFVMVDEARSIPRDYSPKAHEQALEIIARVSQTRDALPELKRAHSRRQIGTRRDLRDK